MNKEEILAMEAGRGMDWDVAQLLNVGKEAFDFAYEAGNYNYSSDISAAWEVFIIFDFPSLEKGHDEDGNDYFVAQIGPHRVIGETAPTAICKAALLAVTHP